jgi:hypothetical protein
MPKIQTNHTNMRRGITDKESAILLAIRVLLRRYTGPVGNEHVEYRGLQY